MPLWALWALWVCAASCCFLFPSHNPIVGVVSGPPSAFLLSPISSLRMPSFLCFSFFSFSFCPAPHPRFRIPPLPASPLVTASTTREPKVRHTAVAARLMPPSLQRPRLGCLASSLLPCSTHTRYVCECPCPAPSSSPSVPASTTTPLSRAFSVFVFASSEAHHMQVKLCGRFNLGPLQPEMTKSCRALGVYTTKELAMQSTAALLN